ncbi:MAG: translation initiation factor IF-2 associated domain-containing protein, partial [Pseudomonadota bacterium]
MSDKGGDTKTGGRTLGLRGGSETSHVRQSFSHGRSKSVLVEKKKKRVVVPKAPAGRSAAPGAAPVKPSSDNPEFERRKRALQ